MLKAIKLDCFFLKEIINILVETVSKNGNLLLNAGLNQEGEFIGTEYFRLKDIVT